MDILGGFLGFLAAILVIVATFKVIRKAGYSGWWVLLTFVPVVNVVMLWLFAFADWPAHRRREVAPP